MALRFILGNVGDSCATNKPNMKPIKNQSIYWNLNPSYTLNIFVYCNIKPSKIKPMASICSEFTKEIHDEYYDWYKNAKSISVPLRPSNHVKSWLNNPTGIINASTHTTGTYSHVWTDYHQPDGTICAIKSPMGDAPEKQMQLYAEYKLHCKVYEKYIEEGLTPKVIKPLWLKLIAFNNGVACPTMCMGMERIDCTIYEKLIEQGRQDTDMTRRWKKEIVEELARVGKEWEFFHRDCHLMNMAVVNNEWKFFDLGMSIAFDMEPFPGGNPFYKWGLKPKLTHDKRLLLFSWDAFGDDDDWVEKEKLRLENAPKRFWKTDMPVIVKGHPQANGGTFEYVDTRGGVVVEIWVPTSTKTITINSKIRPPSTYETTEGGHSLSCIFKAKDVKPDVGAEHIHYYFPTYE